MSRFDECLKFVLEREGGYVDHPNDRGGATNKGITQGNYDVYRAGKGWPLQPVKYILPDEVSDIYRTRYWRACLCDRMPVPLDLVVFDSAVNHGPRQAIKFLQRAVGTEDDGVIGPKTLSAIEADVHADMLGVIISSIISQREIFYDMLVEKDHKQSVFRKGWGNRIYALAEEVKEIT